MKYSILLFTIVLAPQILFAQNAQIIPKRGVEGIGSRVNYIYEIDPKKEKIDQLVNVLSTIPFDSTQLIDFFKEERNSNKPYSIGRSLGFFRHLEFDFEQISRRFRLGSTFYEVNVIMKNGEPAHIKLFSEDSVIYAHSNKDLLDLLFSRRKDVYTNQSSQIENPINRFDSSVFGSFCGFSGRPPDKAERMLELVNADNYEELTAWLNSINPEISAYGYTGLFFLEKKGFQVQESERKLMRHIRSLKIYLNTCSGCFIGETDTIQESLSTGRLEANYRSYKETGWLSNN